MDEQFDRELERYPFEERWSVWKGRVEAVLFASSSPLPMDRLARVVGEQCNLLSLLLEIQRETGGRAYELSEVAGGWQLRTRPEFGDAVRVAGVTGASVPDLTPRQLTVLMAIAYFQPITRGELATILGKPVSRDTISSLSRSQLIAPGSRSPLPGAPYTYVTTPRFLSDFGFKSLRDLPDIDALAEAGLLDRRDLLNRDDLFLELEKALPSEDE